MSPIAFEKWQALGNDYLIVEAGALPFALTPERVRRLCDPHLGPGGDGVLELSPPEQPGFVARLRIFNPDGSEAELSGNGAREAVMYLRAAGWTDADRFSIQTAAGEMRPTITACEQLRTGRVVRPPVDVLVRLIGAARESAHAATSDALAPQLSQRNRARELDGLLELLEPGGVTWLEWLRTRRCPTAPRQRSSRSLRSSRCSSSSGCS